MQKSYCKSQCGADDELSPAGTPFLCGGRPKTAVQGAHRWAELGTGGRSDPSPGCMGACKPARSVGHPAYHWGWNGGLSLEKLTSGEGRKDSGKSGKKGGGERKENLKKNSCTCSGLSARFLINPHHSSTKRGLLLLPGHVDTKGKHSG